MKNVLLIGATGNLGGMIGHELLALGARLRVLVREGSRMKLAPEIAAKAEIVEDEAGAFAGIDTVVSAVQGGPDIIVASQLQWLAAARSAGVKRFIPSDYSFNFLNLAEGENINSDWRRQFSTAASTERGDVEVVHIMNGCFLDHGVLFGFLGAMDLKKKEAYLWGDGNQKMEFTTYADTAKFTAAAALDPHALPTEFEVAGDSLSFHELVAEVEAGLGDGTMLSVKKMGSMADLDVAVASGQREQPENPYAWLPNMYWRGMLSGKGHLKTLRNGRYPWIQAARVREYLSKA